VKIRVAINRVLPDRILKDYTLKDYTTNTMTSVSRHNVDRMLAETPVVSVLPAYKLETRVDIALLASALFLQRFTLPFFRDKMISLALVSTALILIHQFASGRLFIQYDRLLWFLVMALAATSSLLSNFESRMLTSYGLFVLIYFLFTMSRPSTLDQYKSTLHGFQSLVLILSCIAIVQFPAQFIVDPRKLIMFYGIFPDVLLPPLDKAGVNTMGIISGPGGLIKSNGILLKS